MLCHYPLNTGNQQVFRPVSAMSATCSLSDPADGKVPLRLVLNHPAIWPARKGFTEISGKAARAWGIKLPKEKTMRAMVAAIQAEKKQILERGRQEGRQEGLNQGLERAGANSLSGWRTRSSEKGLETGLLRCSPGVRTAGVWITSPGQSSTATRRTNCSPSSWPKTVTAPGKPTPRFTMTMGKCSVPVQPWERPSSGPTL